MADHFLSGLQNLKQSFSLSDIEPNIEFMNHFPGLNTIHPETPGLIGYPNDNLFSHYSEIPGTVPELFIHQGNNAVSSSPDRMISAENDRQEKKKRRSTDNSTPESSTANSFQDSDNGIGRKNITGKGKKLKNNEKAEEEKPREVVHVRAKRGQATDSHSLAERIRREKINERLRCLQDIVPGCYKTMGMAVMLDEIINYVQSLQNQIEFLSMKLNAATTFYDFNSDTDVIEAMQRAKAMEALKIQKIASQEFASVHFPSLDLNSGYYLQFPHNT